MLHAGSRIAAFLPPQIGAEGSGEGDVAVARSSESGWGPALRDQIEYNETCFKSCTEIAEKQ